MSKKLSFLIDVDASNLALPLESTSSGDGGVGTDLGTLGGGLEHGDSVLPGGADYVGLTMLDIGECGVAFCGGLIGRKGSGKMCVLSGCQVKCHKVTKCDMKLRGQSESNCHVFIDCSRDEKAHVWACVNIPFENLHADWDELKNDKRPMEVWNSVFDRLGASKSTVEDIRNAVSKASSTTEEIIEFNVMSPQKKRPHSAVEVPAADARSLVDIYSEATEGTDINRECLTIMDHFDKRLRVQESHNSAESILDRTQEMVEVHNRIGHRSKDVAPMSLQEQLIVEGSRTNVLEETALTQNEREMVQFITDNYGPDLHSFAQLLMDRVLASITPHFRPLQYWINSFTSSKHAVPGDRLET